MNCTLNGLNNDVNALNTQLRIRKDKFFNECLFTNELILSDKLDKIIKIFQTYKQIFNDIESLKIQIKDIGDKIKLVEEMKLS